MQAGEPDREGADAAVVHAHPVDHRPALQPEQPGPGIAVLRPGRDGAELDRAEAEPQQPRCGDRILVEPGGQPDRVAQRPAQQAGGQHRVVGGRPTPGQPQLQGAESKAVGALGIDAAQGGQEGGGDGWGHACSRACHAGADWRMALFMWDEPYLETCCRSALHRLLLVGASGRPPGLKDGPCLARLEGLGLAQARDDGRYEATEAGLARHAVEIAPTAAVKRSWRRA